MWMVPPSGGRLGDECGRACGVALGVQCLTPEQSPFHIAPMSRSVAFVAFLALSWSHVAGLRCDMGAASHAHSPAPAHETHSGHAAAEDTPTTPPAPDHGGSHGCLMLMACSIASPRPAHPAAMIRIPTVLVRTAFPAPPIPVAADLAVETPPPRHPV